MKSSNIETLATQLGINDPAQIALFAQELDDWTHRYVRYLDDASYEPTPKDVEADLKKLGAAFSGLNAQIETASLDVELSISGVIGETLLDGVPNGFEPYLKGDLFLQNFREELRFLALAAQTAADGWNAQKLGPQAKKLRTTIRREAVFELAPIWEKFTGKRFTLGGRDLPSFGPCYDFVVTALKFMFDPQEAEAAYHDIRDVSQRRNKK